MTNRVKIDIVGKLTFKKFQYFTHWFLIDLTPYAVVLDFGIERRPRAFPLVLYWFWMCLKSSITLTAIGICSFKTWCTRHVFRRKTC